MVLPVDSVAGTARDPELALLLEGWHIQSGCLCWVVLASCSWGLLCYVTHNNYLTVGYLLGRASFILHGLCPYLWPGSPRTPVAGPLDKCGSRQACQAQHSTPTVSLLVLLSRASEIFNSFLVGEIRPKSEHGAVLSDEGGTRLQSSWAAGSHFNSALMTSSLR